LQPIVVDLENREDVIAMHFFEFATRLWMGKADLADCLPGGAKVRLNV
jgi:hypothetical protein